MSQKMLFCFTNISAEILLHILDYNFYIEHHILAHLCQMMLPLKASKIISEKAHLLWRQNVGGIYPPRKSVKSLKSRVARFFFL
jgi:hypothetical protein